MLFTTYPLSKGITLPICCLGSPGLPPTSLALLHPTGTWKHRFAYIQVFVLALKLVKSQRTNHARLPWSPTTYCSLYLAAVCPSRDGQGPFILENSFYCRKLLSKCLFRSTCSALPCRGSVKHIFRQLTWKFSEVRLVHSHHWSPATRSLRWYGYMINANKYFIFTRKPTLTHSPLTPSYATWKYRSLVSKNLK